MRKDDAELILFGIVLIAAWVILESSQPLSDPKPLVSHEQHAHHTPSIGLQDENIPRPLLEKLLKRMVEAEDYEAAALIRDELNRTA